ncbi:hypothetical protein An07g01600 [Aspergillus niger]|uniref:Uncharacterized protein n=2 Tax=Aspergillus niger TaxID=5061 RepID=A2QMC4_ASPNC|nr:hypothetical protein An07g01600 [Aspergillus niger]CAK96605.1 hypothetical protein An07g01600 [Aspergillus niger]
MAGFGCVVRDDDLMYGSVDYLELRSRLGWDFRASGEAGRIGSLGLRGPSATYLLGLVSEMCMCVCVVPGVLISSSSQMHECGVLRRADRQPAASKRYTGIVQGETIHELYPRSLGRQFMKLLGAEPMMVRYLLLRVGEVVLRTITGIAAIVQFYIGDHSTRTPSVSGQCEISTVAIIVASVALWLLIVVAGRVPVRWYRIGDFRAGGMRRGHRYGIKHLS